MYAGPGGKLMKNIIKINSIAITVEGNPIELNGIEFTNEASAQELATSGALIKGLINELKPLIQEAVKPQATEPVVRRVERVEPTPTPAPVKVSATPVEKKSLERKNLSKAFREIERPVSLKETGFKTWEWKSQETIPTRIINVKASELDHVMISLKVSETWVHVHVRPDNTRIVGVSPEDFIEFLNYGEFPGDVREYVEKVATL